MHLLAQEFLTLYYIYYILCLLPKIQVACQKHLYAAILMLTSTKYLCSLHKCVAINCLNDSSLQPLLNPLLNLPILLLEDPRRALNLVR